MVYQGEESVGSQNCQKYTASLDAAWGTQTADLWVEPASGLCMKGVYTYQAPTGDVGTKGMECTSFNTDGIALPSVE